MYIYVGVYICEMCCYFLVHSGNLVMNISPLSLTLPSLNRGITPGIGLFPILELKSPIINILLFWVICLTYIVVTIKNFLFYLFIQNYNEHFLWFKSFVWKYSYTCFSIWPLSLPQYTRKKFWYLMFL